MTDIFYSFGDQIYINLTSHCPCRCTFCVRDNHEGLGSAAQLWHHHEPEWDQIRAAADAVDLSGQKELVFCGYGEPTCALEHLLRLAGYLKEKKPDLRLRLNTNGLSDRINGRPTADELCRVIDRFSVSLNAPNARRYNEICLPRWGEESFAALLDFARQCKENGRPVTFSVVDVISPEEIDQCRALAQDMGIPLRVRCYAE